MSWRDLRACNRGAASVEFVVVAPAFLILFFLAIEVASAFFWWKTAEKATQLGARIAIVRDVAATGLPLRNPKRAGAVFGLACAHPSNPCNFDNQSTWICAAAGSGCNSVAFQNIMTEMKRIFGQAINDSNLSVAYNYNGLGYAGGLSYRR